MLKQIFELPDFSNNFFNKVAIIKGETVVLEKKIKTSEKQSSTLLKYSCFTLTEIFINAVC